MKSFILSIILSGIAFFNAISQDISTDSILHFASENLYDNYTISDSLLRIVVNRKDQDIENEMLYEAYFKLGNLNKHFGFYEEAETFINLAIEEAKRLDNLKLMSKSTMFLADNYMDKNEFAKAIEYSLIAIDFAVQLNDSFLLADSYGNLAENYRVGADFSRAIKYNLLSIKMFGKLKDSSHIIRIYNNYSIIIAKMGRNDEAVDSLKKALSILSPKDLFGRAKIYSSIAYCYRNVGDYNGALKYNLLSLEIKQRIKDYHGIGYSLGAIGRSYLGLGKNDSALYFIKQSLDSTKKYKNPYKIKDAYQYMSDALRSDGQFEKAILYVDSVMALDDSIYQEEIASQADLYKRKYDLSKKEQEIIRLEQERKVQQSENRLMWSILVSVLIFGVLLVFVLVLWTSKNTQKRKWAELKLKTTQEEINRNKQDLKSFANDLMQKNKAIKKLSDQLIEKDETIQGIRDEESINIQELVDSKILTDEDWVKFKVLFEKVYPGYFIRLRQSKHKFTPGEKRLLSLMKLNLNTKEMADTLGISADSVTKAKFRLKKKLVISEDVDLESFVQQLL